MPFKGNRIVVFIFIAVLIVIGLIAVVANSPSARKPGNPDIVVCTIRASVGVDYIRVTNLNTGTSIILTSINMPYNGYSFNCTEGDTIRTTVYTLNDYIFNTWTFNDGTFDDSNPLIKPILTDTMMSANVLYVPPTVTSTPKPSVIE